MVSCTAGSFPRSTRPGARFDAGLETAYGQGVRIATICEASSTPAIWRIELPRWLHQGALAGALLALLALTISPAPERARSMVPSAAAAKLEAIPLAARPLVSRTLGRDQASYGIQRTGSGLTAANVPHGLWARFGLQGVQVRAGSETLALRLRAAGYGQTLLPVLAAAPAAHANRVSYRRGALTEWYANGPLGLEQGFTLQAPPTAASDGPLTLGLSLSGNLRPVLEPGGRALGFAGSSLRYAGLTVFDARGHSLPARLALRGQTQSVGRQRHGRVPSLRDRALRERRRDAT